MKITAVEVDQFILQSWHYDVCADEMLAHALMAQKWIDDFSNKPVGKTNEHSHARDCGYSDMERS